MFGSKTRERKRVKAYRELKAVARDTVLFYFQSWGQGVEGRIKALNKAVAAAGIDAVFEQRYNAETMETKAGWRGLPSEAQRAIRFRAELARCFPLGHFESEVEAVMAVISATKHS